MLAELKALANKIDVPYQSLAKVYLARQIALERGAGACDYRFGRQVKSDNQPFHFLRTRRENIFFVVKLH